MTYTPPPGDVARWHAHPDSRLRLSGDTINSHQQRCVDLLMRIYPNASQPLIEAVRYHDEAERWLGDMPYMAKQQFSDLAAAMREAEICIEMDHGIPAPKTTFDRSMVKIVDRLDAYLWMLDCAPDLAKEKDWIAALDALILLSDQMGVAWPVSIIINEKGLPI